MRANHRKRRESAAPRCKIRERVTQWGWQNPQSAISIDNPLISIDNPPSQSTISIDNLNRQSTISIDNRQSQSTIDNLKIRNLQSEIGNQLCHKPPPLTLYKSERIRAGGDVSLDLHGSRDR